MSRDSAVGIATGYGLDDRGVGVRVPVGLRIFSSPCRPDWLWGTPSFLFNGYRGHQPSCSGLVWSTYEQTTDMMELMCFDTLNASSYKENIISQLNHNVKKEW
jgi:hypothetical protein